MNNKTLQSIINNIKNDLAGARLKDWIKFGLIIVIGIGLMAFAINQVMDAVYNLNVASDPCGVCRQANPGIKIIKTIPINWDNISFIN